ncbi:MAG: hypothetical protein JXD18_12710 [Anaerolineae bacterium]|nr:hypothetical protein [Anaerolineae bacterium]
MSFQEITYKQLEPTLTASASFVITARAELPGLIDSVRQQIPEAAIAGPPVCTLWYVSNVSGGYAVDVGFPVTQPVETEALHTQMSPALEVLALLHTGPLAAVRESYGALHAYADARSLISDERTCEVYLDLSGYPDVVQVELQFVIHNWHRLLGESVERALGVEARREVLGEGDALVLDWSDDERFRWVVGAMERLNRLAPTARGRYEIVSRCAHVFPAAPIDDLRAAYQAARVETDDLLEAVDALIDYMKGAPGWGDVPRREGRVLYWIKAPRDRQGFEAATTDLERKKAYCFCPLIRNHLDQPIPDTFCNCSSGWFRQQFEGAFGLPVHIEIVESLIKGDDCCQFAIYLPEDL